MICEFCKKKYIEYHCLECRRNICNDCFENHKGHRYYYNRDYISEEEIIKIRSIFNESQDIIKTNIELINKKIIEFESQLNELKALLTIYKNINNKLSSFCNLILNQYTDLAKLKKEIYYPLYFNLINILLFNPHQLTFPEEDISIKSFTDNLNEKLKTGLYFIITNSNFSENLNEYNESKEYFINYNNINFKEFNKIYLEYLSIIPFTDNKFFGIKKNNGEESLDIYNINNKNIETTIYLSWPVNILYEREFNMLILNYGDSLFIMNPKDYSISQKISKKKNIQKENGNIKSNNCLWLRDRNNSDDTEDEDNEIIYVEILSNNSFAVIYEGNPCCLGEDYIDLMRKSYNKPINTYDTYFDPDRYEDFSYLIIYEKKNEIFSPIKIIYLIKNKINNNDVSYTTWKHINVEETYPYCIFDFNSFIKISENKFIIVLNSKIEIDRDQDYYYITDNNYIDGIIYYYLEIEEENIITKTICSTEKRTFLFKNEQEKIFYYFYNEEEKEDEKLKIILDENSFKLIKIKTDYIYETENLKINKNIIIWWNSSGVYYGNRIKNEIEILDKRESGLDDKITFISFNKKCIFYMEK